MRHNDDLVMDVPDKVSKIRDVRGVCTARPKGQLTGCEMKQSSGKKAYQDRHQFRREQKTERVGSSAKQTTAQGLLLFFRRHSTDVNAAYLNNSHNAHCK